MCPPWEANSFQFWKVPGGTFCGGGRGNQHNPQCANYWAPLTRKRHIPPHSAQPRHTNDSAPRTRKRHQQEHRPQQPTERSDPTQHAKGRPGDCPGPRKETTTGRNVTQGGNYWAPLTHKSTRSNQHNPSTPTAGLRQRKNDTSSNKGRSGPPNATTRHAKGRTGDCSGPHKEAAARRNVTQGGGGGALHANRATPSQPPPPLFFGCAVMPVMHGVRHLIKGIQRLGHPHPFLDAVLCADAAPRIDFRDTNFFFWPDPPPPSPRCRSRRFKFYCLRQGTLKRD